MVTYVSTKTKKLQRWMPAESSVSTAPRRHSCKSNNPQIGPSALKYPTCIFWITTSPFRTRIKKGGDGVANHPRGVNSQRRIFLWPMVFDKNTARKEGVARLIPGCRNTRNFGRPDHVGFRFNWASFRVDQPYQAPPPSLPSRWLGPDSNKKGTPTRLCRRPFTGQQPIRVRATGRPTMFLTSTAS